MNMHNVYTLIFKIWRKKRMMQFVSIIKPEHDDVLLDVGGSAGTWTTEPQRVERIDCLNIRPIDWNNSNPEYRIHPLTGDGCQLPFPDKSYDILFSNSVIEHVGDWEKQISFAKEARRVGKKLWIQTPAYECPLEPHYMAPFVHWFPVRVRRKILRWVTPWGLISRPSQRTVDETIAFTKLLSKAQVTQLFPDCVIITERLFFIFPKSYVAYRL